MPAEVITAALSLMGTLVGTLGGIALSSNLTNYRIEQLEKKVGSTITSSAGRTSWKEYSVLDDGSEWQNHRIEDLEKEEVLHEG